MAYTWIYTWGLLTWDDPREVGFSVCFLVGRLRFYQKKVENNPDFLTPKEEKETSSRISLFGSHFILGCTSHFFSDQPKANIFERSKLKYKKRFFPTIVFGIKVKFLVCSLELACSSKRLSG